MVVAIAVTIATVATVWVLMTEPAWYLRSTLPLRYTEIIETHACNYDLEAPLVAAVIRNESGFDAAAESSAGAVGLMQLTPDTGQGIADRTGGGRWTTDDLLDPELNVRYGSWYLNHLTDVFADADDPVVAALAAYNAGQGTVRGWLDEQGGGLSITDIRFAETRAYVREVLADTARYEAAYPDLEAAGCR